MTREEAVALLERYSNYDGMGIPNLAGCKEAMKVAVESLKEVYPELRESEDEKVMKWIIEKVQGYADSGLPFPEEIQMANKALAYLEKQKENIEKEYIFRPLAGTLITTAAEQAIRRAKEGEHLVLAFNGAYIPVREYNSAKELIDEYDTYRKKKKEQKTDAKSERVIKAARRVLNNWLNGTDCPDVSGDFTELEYAISEYDGEEKQKEQKPILEVFGFKVGDAVRLKDGDGRKHIIKSFEEVEGIHGPNFYYVEFEDNSARDGIYPGEEYPNGYYTQMEKFEEEQKPAEWSEEDEKDVAHIIRILDDCYAYGRHDLSKTDHENLVGTLKSLRPSWKPSEGQIGALERWLLDNKFKGDSRYVYPIFESLYNDLKKLM